jgi:hypothetical protein
MLATFGLERLESRLNRDTLRAVDVAEFLERAQPSDVAALARDGMPEALDCFHRRRMQRIEPSMEAVMEASALYARKQVRAQARVRVGVTSNGATNGATDGATDGHRRRVAPEDVGGLTTENLGFQRTRHTDPV